MKISIKDRKEATLWQNLRNRLSVGVGELIGQRAFDSTLLAKLCVWSPANEMHTPYKRENKALVYGQNLEGGKELPETI